MSGDMTELLLEALDDMRWGGTHPALGALMAADESGWVSASSDDTSPIDVHRIRATSLVLQVMLHTDPLIGSASQVRTGMVWGRGCAVTADAGDGDTGGQDINAVVQAFLDANVETFTGTQAREQCERSLQSDGQLFWTLVTDPSTGSVRVRVVPLAQVVDILDDPEDATQRQYYLREWTQRVVEGGYSGSQRIRSETRRAYHPDINYQPGQRPQSIGGVPIWWDQPIHHVRVNPSGRWGVPDFMAAVPWAKGYRSFLHDWAGLARALSRWAWQIQTRRKAGAGRVRDALQSPAIDPSAPIPRQTLDPAGATSVTAGDTRVEAVSKTGALLPSEGGRPLAAMVAAATGVPVTMLLGDPGVTGARATAETLDRPLDQQIGLRQTFHAHAIARVLDYVIDAAIRAPGGPLDGTLETDPITGGDRWVLAGGQSRAVRVEFPDPDPDPGVLMSAVTAADSTEMVPPLVLLRVMLRALRVDDPDEILDQVVDGDGRFVWPYRDGVGRDALAAVQQGDLPAD